MKTELNGWQHHYREAMLFWDLASKGLNRNDRITPVVIYSLVDIVIEKLLMALLIYHDFFPINHGLTDLVSLLDRKQIVGKELLSIILQFERFQAMGTMYDSKEKAFYESDINFFMKAGQFVLDFAGDYFKEDNGPV